MSGPVVITDVDGEPAMPEVLARVAEECGHDAAIALAATFGGRELYVPRPENIGEHHPMAVALGFASAKKAAAVLGAGKLIIPLGPSSTPARRRTLVRELKRQGRSNAYVAQALGVHLRTVERYVQADRGPEPDQGDLFDIG